MTYFQPPFLPKMSRLMFALAAVLAGCGGNDTGTATSANPAVQSAAQLTVENAAGGKKLALFSNRQKIAEVDVPAEAASPDANVGADLKRTLVNGDLVGDASRIDASKSLLINGLGVVNDPRRTFDPSRPENGTKGGVWSFGHLMRDLVAAKGNGKSNGNGNGPDESEFARAWITSFLNNSQGVRGEQVAPRPAMADILADWERRSGVQPGGKLDLDMAPFRLLAIVNRIDVRDPSKPGDAGEARFVFGAIDPDGKPLQFTLIFEYGVQLHPSHDAVQAWARQWVNLGKYQLPQQQEQYNAALQAITDQFTTPDKGFAAAGKSPLNQIRTNEALNRAQWELREFVVDRDSRLLKPASVKRTPQFGLQNSALLGEFINEYAQAILDGSYEVPEEYKGQVFATAIAPTPTGAAAVGWNAPNISTANSAQDLRRVFSLNTCSGCHHRETNAAGTFFFTHVRPRTFDTASALSVFLTGKDEAGTPVKANDPVSNAELEYNDLERRAIFLDAIVSNPPSSLPGQKRLKMVH